jgi:hypothetical protein
MKQLFKKLLSKKIKEEIQKRTKEENKIIEEIRENLKDCEKSEGFCIFTSKLFKDGEEEKVQHKFAAIRFGADNLLPAVEQYEKLVNAHLDKINDEERLKSVQGKLPGAVSAPIVKNGSKTTQDSGLEPELADYTPKAVNHSPVPKE